MKTFIVLAVLAALLLFYVLHGRAWLKGKPWMQGFFDVVEPIEVALWKKSETILFARVKMLTGLLLTLLTQLGTIDLTPLMPFVPDKYRSFVTVGFNSLPLLITMLGFVDEMLRRDTTKPLELVAIADKDMTPAVAEAIAVADAAKVEAVAEVKEAKA